MGCGDCNFRLGLWDDVGHGGGCRRKPGKREGIFEGHEELILRKTGFFKEAPAQEMVCFRQAGPWSFPAFRRRMGQICMTSHQSFHVRAFGAVGNGTVKETQAIQSAIDACHAAGGGRVVFEKGTYLTAPFFLKSNVELHLQNGAVILGSGDIEDYFEWKTTGVHFDAAVYNARALLIADKAENIAITGEGTIEGQSAPHYDRSNPGVDFWPVIDRKTRPGRMLWFILCRNVRIEGVTLNDAPAWTIWMAGCERVRIQNVTINTRRQAINTDGIDIDSCRDVEIRHCNIDTGDDCIVLRAIDRFQETPRPCEQVLVENCTLRSSCNAIRISYLRDGVIRNATFRNITVTESRRGIICQIPAPTETPERRTDLPAGNGTVVENLYFGNCRIKARQPLWFVLSDDWQARRLENFTFENITAVGTNAMVFKGNAAAPVKNLVIRNLEMALTHGQPFYRSVYQQVEEAAAFLSIAHCENAVLENITVRGENGQLAAELPVAAVQGPAVKGVEAIRNHTPRRLAHVY